MRKLLVLGLVACGQVRVPAPSPIETPHRTSEAVYETPAPVSVPAWKTTCSSSTARPVRWHRAWGDAYQQTLAPVTWGPRAANRSRATPTRSAAQLDRAIGRRAHEVAQCWKWASARGASATRVDLAVTIDPFGASSDLALVAATPNAELTACLSQMLSGLVLGGVTSHASRMHAAIDFQRVDQP